MKSLVYVNCFEYGKSALSVEWAYPRHAYYLGNNVDLDGCKDKDVKEARKRLSYFKQMFKERFARGHAELDHLSGDPWYIFEGPTMLCNGCTLFWGDDACNSYVSHTEEGSSVLKRMFYRPRRSPSRLNNTFLVNVANKAEKFNVKKVICGYHGRKKLEFFHKGIHVLVLPRGKHEIEL